ncbi:hypothetical protein GGF46_000993 [Coemansia sp. RSA 552]|nr:hypothetical protein GGF46_000993 [Coemansia sp. RSA 552]
MSCCFQKLPWDIVCGIISQIIDARQLARTTLFACGSRHVIEGKVLLPLLGVSRVWRLSTLAHMSQSYEIGFNHRNMSAFAGCKHWPGYIPGHQSCIAEFVKTVDLYVDFAAIATGQALEYLKNAADKPTLFPNAHTLTIWLKNGFAQLADLESGMLSNVDGFFNNVRTQFPSVRNVRLSSSGEYYSQTHIVTCAINGSVSSLLASARQAELVTLKAQRLPALITTPATRLTAMKSVWDGSYKRVLELIHRNADGLRCLELSFSMFEGFSKLVRDGQNEVSYPKLQRLVFGQNGVWKAPITGLTTTNILFPSLCHLQMEFEYPFRDNTLFRGNEDTLQHLQIVPNGDVFKRLNNLGVFTGGLTIEACAQMLPVGLKELEFVGKDLCIYEITMLLERLTNLVILTCGYFELAAQGMRSIDEHERGVKTNMDDTERDCMEGELKWLLEESIPESIGYISQNLAAITFLKDSGKPTKSSSLQFSLESDDGDDIKALNGIQVLEEYWLLERTC